MKLRKFDACPNHCILYGGKEYKNLISCLLCSASLYKRDAGYRMDEDDMALRGGPKKRKRAKKSSVAEKILSMQDEEEEGYT